MTWNWNRLLVAGGLLTALPAAAQLTQERATVSAGGGTLTSSQYALTGTIGQASPVGALSNATLTIHAGFWHGVAMPLTFTLTVQMRGTGRGSVTGPGIACGADCTEQYAAGTTLDLRAAPDVCSRFVRWEDAAGQPMISPLTISVNLTAAAVFDACCPAPATPLSPPNGNPNWSIFSGSLSWKSAAGATSYDVYFGTTPPLSKLISVPSNFPYTLESDLATNTTYFWRVDAVNACGATPGAVWSFTTESPFDERPLVRLSLDPSLLLLGESVAISSSATDDVGVTEFHVTVNDVEIASAPGDVTFTPSAAGEYEITALAKDADGNLDLRALTLFVNDPASPSVTSVRWYEGFQPLTGRTERDPNVMIFLPQKRTEMSSASFPGDAPPKLRLSSLAAFHFIFQRAGTTGSAAVLVTEPGVTAALLTGRTFESVTGADASAAVFEAWPEGQPVTAAHVALLRMRDAETGEVTYIKIGKFREDLEEMRVYFSSQILIP